MKRKSNMDKQGRGKKLSVAAKVFLIVISVLLSLLVVAAFFAKYYLDKVNYAEKETSTFADKEVIAEYFPEESSSKSEEILKMDEKLKENAMITEDSVNHKDVYNILVIGSDIRNKDEMGRSDAMILLSVNQKKKTIYMTSIMRDIYASIPGYGNNRINAAYAFGGADLLMETIKENFGVEVDKYISVDFYSFVDIVDILGGVDMEVSDEEVGIMNDYISELNRLNGREKDEYKLSGGGKLHLNGTQALAYSRVRYVGNADFERTNRQRKVLGQAFEKAKTADILTLNQLLNSALSKVTTNLDKSEVVSLMLKVPAWLKYDLESCRIPVEDSYQFMQVYGMSVLGIDFDKNRQYLKETIK
ncbi:LCP family protein [Frisingicoccus sp.]